jgi:hypothetical protein
MAAVIRCAEMMSPVGALRCDRKAGHKGKHRRRVENSDALTVFEWTRVWR